MTMTLRQQIETAHEMGGKYEMGFWKFPSNEIAAAFKRRVAGLEWTDEMKAKADAALAAQREALKAEPPEFPLEPEGQ